MADNVQWIKLKVGMFDGNSFKKIKRAMIGGVSYRDKLTAIWFELLDLAGKSNANGYLIDNNEIPYHTFEDIAIMLDRETEEIELCMQFFLKEKMVEIIDNIYCLSNFEKYQCVEGLEKIREQKRIAQAKWRERKNQGLIGIKNICVYCGQPSTTIDHIKATSKGGLNIPENAVPCCVRCNSSKTDMDLLDFLNNPVNDFISKESVLNCKKLLVGYNEEDCRFYYVDSTNHLPSISNSNSKSNKFIKPTIEEVTAYCKERNNGIDAEAFIAFYESKGWLIGKTPMKSWKSAVITWEKSKKQTQVVSQTKKYGDVGDMYGE